MNPSISGIQSFFKKKLIIYPLKFALLLLLVAGSYACASSDAVQEEMSSVSKVVPLSEAEKPSPDPRVDLGYGLFDAEEAIWNLNLISNRPSPDDFLGAMNSDLALKDNYVIQGNFNGFIIWDIADPSNPELVVDYLCPASQSDVSVYGNLLFVSGEGLEGRLDCSDKGVTSAVSEDRLRGIRIFDITDIRNPQYISNVQTCRGSHTHSVLEDPKDEENVYVYVSGSAPVRPEDELPGCSAALPDDDPQSALFRIEVIKVPLDNPERSEIVNSPRIFEDLTAPPVHGLAPMELSALEEAKEAGAFIADINGQERVLSDGMVQQLLTEIINERNGSGEPTAADSTILRNRLPNIIATLMADNNRGENLGPNQCHDITLFPEIGLAGGACEGYGILLDISDPTNPTRIDAVADSNFAYWHSATFNNDGNTIIFTDEWGGGTQPKCRETDPYEWGANAIFTIEDGKMAFKSYFKMDAPQTTEENCVAHNGSLIPVPGRDIMVQSWYQGGINIFDFTDPANPIEIAYHDRGSINAERLEMGGSWSVYWYNGSLISSEIARGLDIFELIPSDYITENEIAAANTVKMNYFNPQGQPKFEWPPSYALARAYLDQLERNGKLDTERLNSIRIKLSEAESSRRSKRAKLLNELAAEIVNNPGSSSNTDTIKKLASTMKDLASES